MPTDMDTAAAAHGTNLPVARPRQPGWWIGAGVAFVIIVAGLAGLDRWFYEHVSRVLNTEDRPVDSDFYAVTKPFWLFWRYAFGHILGAVAIGGLIAAARPAKLKAVIKALLIVVTVALLANVLQGAIGRLRPNQASSHLAFVPSLSKLIVKNRVSFPSGEAATAFALACVLARLLPRLRLAFYAAATLAALARLMNGAHYLSDVAAGALLGVLAAAAMLTVIRVEPTPVVNRRCGRILLSRQ